MKAYTTNSIEAFHRQLRKVTKTKGSFTSDTALMTAEGSSVANQAALPRPTGRYG